MESLFDDYGFGSAFLELGEKKFGETQKNEDSNNLNDAFDFNKSGSSSRSRDVENDILNEIGSFSGIKNESIGNRSAATFDEPDLKYLLTKSIADAENKKAGKNKKETEEDERERMQ